MNSKDMARQIDLMLRNEVRRYEDGYGNVYEVVRDVFYSFKQVRPNGTVVSVTYFDKVEVHTGYLALMNGNVMAGGILTDDLEVKDTL